jgi:hypothetical protein
MESGLCKYSIYGLIQYAMMLCTTSNNAKMDIEGASQIANAAMSCSKTQYNTTEQLTFLNCAYYGIVAFYTEPLQVCADVLQQGFNDGMSLGDTGKSCFNFSQHIRTAIIAGDRLFTLLKTVDYYLRMASSYQNKTARAYLSVNCNTISLLTWFDPGWDTLLQFHVFLVLNLR